MADEMLAASLGDSDAQNVQLAARYLGIVGARGAAQALMAVARGDGRGNRDVPPRVEAIEALGRMGATEAIPLLNDLAGRRAIIRSGRVKEIRAAAESALAAISAASNGGV
jgi:HEAT repeat protein